MPSQCSFCGHGNPFGAKYCNECGSPLNFKPCAECGAVNEGSALGCYKCGAKLPDADVQIVDRGDPAPRATMEIPAASHTGLPQTIPAYDPPSNERRKVRVSRLTLSILIATTAAVAGYVGHGLSAGDDIKPDSVVTPGQGVTKERAATGSGNSVSAPITVAPTGAPGDSTAPADADNGARSAAAQAATGAPTAGAAEHQDTTTGSSNATASSPPSDAAPSVQGPNPVERRMPTPVGKPSVKSSTQPRCTQQQRLLGLCA